MSAAKTQQQKSEDALSIKNVGVSYGAFKAIQDVDLNVKAGECFGLIGLNGAGKTTLIKAILDLRTPSDGEILIFNQRAGTKAVKQRLAFLPERFEPPWFLTGLEFLKFSARMYKTSVSDAQCIEYAERIALDPAALDRRVHTYSKGMRQKLGVLATILTDCDLLILDEPMSGLDPVARALVKTLIVEARQKGCTVFLSSHILADMDEICDRVAVMHDRSIRFTGKPDKLKALSGDLSLEQAFLHFIEQKSAA